MQENYKQLYLSLSSEQLEPWMTGDWLKDKKRFIREQEELFQLLNEDIDLDDNY